MERKAFNFYKSYYDVFKEMTSDKDKLSFIEALLDRQFNGIEPSELKGMAKFAYISQKEVIDKQIKGWEDKTGNVLSTPRQGGVTTPRQQEKEEEKEEEKGEYTLAFKNEREFIGWFNNGMKALRGEMGKNRVLSYQAKSNFKKLNKAYPIEDFKHALTMMNKSEWVIKSAKNFTTDHFLKIGNFNRYLNQNEEDFMTPEQKYNAAMNKAMNNGSTSK